MISFISDVAKLPQQSYFTQHVKMKVNMGGTLGEGNRFNYPHAYPLVNNRL